MVTEEDDLINQVLTNKKAKRKRSIDEEDADVTKLTTTEIESASAPFDENDMQWATKYIEQQQTQLILSLLDDDPGKMANNVDDNNDEQVEEDNYKSLRPSLETMGLGKY